MRGLKAWFKAVVVGYRRHLTDEQLSGEACALCGHRFFASEYRTDFGWVGVPLRRRAYTCASECVITSVGEVEQLFRSAIPAWQGIRFWTLGVDDVPLVTDSYGGDMPDPDYMARRNAQPTARVEIVHADGVLVTSPLPQKYAGYITVQAQQLGLEASVVKDGAPATAGSDGAR